MADRLEMIQSNGFASGKSQKGRINSNNVVEALKHLPHPWNKIKIKDYYYIFQSVCVDFNILLTN